MKYIKLFEELNNFYKEISYEEYIDMHSTMVNFDRKYGNRILEIIKHYKNNTDIIKYDDDRILQKDTDLYHDVKNTSGRNGWFSGEVYGYEMNDDDRYTCTLKIKKNEKVAARHRKIIEYKLEILQNEDEFFCVKKSLTIKDTVTPITYYKCDQFDGLLQFICDIIEEKFDI